jgi:hypothetical protein
MSPHLRAHRSRAARLSHRALLVVLGGASVLLAAPAVAAAAPRVESVQVNSVIPARIDGLIGFTPVAGIGRRVQPVRYGGRSFRFRYLNSTTGAADTTQVLSRLGSRYASATHGGFLDGRVPSRHRKRVVVRADLGRDADVVVVAAQHPACIAGITAAQAQGIARGTVTRWSQILSLPPGQPDAIDVRVQTGSLGTMVPLWGVTGKRKYADRARRAADGGLSQAARGDRAVAGLTSWSRARRSGASVCAVPVNGVAPTDASVYALGYPAAFPISYAVSHALAKASRNTRAVMSGFVTWLKGPDAGKLLRQSGMLLVADGPPAPPAPAAPPPEQDGSEAPQDAQVVSEPPPGAVPAG